MRNTTSTFAQIVDKVRLMSEEQQKLLWLQLNQDAIYAAAEKADRSTKRNNVSINEIIKLTNDVRNKKKKA